MTTATNNIKNDRNLSPSPFAKTYFHGTKADLRPGNLIAPGYNSNFGQRKNAHLDKLREQGIHSLNDEKL